MISQVFSNLNDAMKWRKEFGVGIDVFNITEVISAVAALSWLIHLKGGWQFCIPLLPL